MTFKHDWKHPVSGPAGYDLFLWWLQRSDERLSVAAETIGVTPRTAQRWMQKKKIPHHVAVLLDQLKNGPAIQGGLWRRDGCMIRFDWKPYLKTKFKDYR